MQFSVTKLDQIEAHLANNPYLTEGGLPGAVDAQIYFDLQKLPDVVQTPNTHYWYQFIGSFSQDLLKRWIQKSKPCKAPQEDDLFDGKPTVKKVETKVKVEKKVEEQDDLFDDKPVEKPVQKKPIVTKKKKDVIAKSIVVFDVKVHQSTTDLDELAKKVLVMEIDGLVWNKDPKKIHVVYDIHKLQFGCVIQDDKVLTDDIFDPIEKWEQVQSVDMVSMQKV